MHCGSGSVGGTGTAVGRGAEVGDSLKDGALDTVGAGVGLSLILGAKETLGEFVGFTLGDAVGKGGCTHPATRIPTQSRSHSLSKSQQPTYTSLQKFCNQEIGEMQRRTQLYTIC